MIYLQLFLSFLQIGAFSFGGGYAAMPLIQSQIVDLHHWLNFKEFTDFQQGLYAKLQSGQMPTGDEQAKMQELGAKIEANPVLKAYLDAQQALSVYVSDIEKIVFGPLQDLLK